MLMFLRNIRELYMTKHSHEAGIPFKGTVSLLLLAVTLFFGPSLAWSDTTQASEYEVKAAYLYQFAKFIEWPSEGAGSGAVNLSICVLGKSPFGGAFSTYVGKKVRNRRVTVAGINRIEELNDCDILFVSTSEKAKLKQILASAASRPVLTISDIKHFAAAGGMIGLISVDDKLRFEINQRATQRSNLRVSAKLLKLAVTVVE